MLHVPSISEGCSHRYSIGSSVMRETEDAKGWGQVRPGGAHTL